MKGILSRWRNTILKKSLTEFLTEKNNVLKEKTQRLQSLIFKLLLNTEHEEENL